MKQKDRDNDDLLRLLDGSLTRDEELAIRARLDKSPSLQEEFLRLSDARRIMQSVIEDSASRALDPFFTDRLMRRVNEAAAGTRRADDLDLASMLGLVFRPVAIAGFILAICLAVYNINLSQDYSVDTTATESILALPPVTSMSVFDIDLYVAESAALQ